MCKDKNYVSYRLSEMSGLMVLKEEFLQLMVMNYVGLRGAHGIEATGP
jgi:hypothetical protein